MPPLRSPEQQGKFPRAAYWAPAVTVAVIIFILSSFPDFGALESGILRESDKLLHAVVYAVLAGCIMWGLGEGFRHPAALKHVMLAALLAAVYGVTDEIHQRFVPGRMGVWQDWLADAVGAMVGAWCAWAFTLYRSPRKV